MEDPALVLLDIQLQGLNGLEGIALVKRKWPEAVVVILSSPTSHTTTSGSRWIAARSPSCPRPSRPTRSSP